MRPRPALVGFVVLAAALVPAACGDGDDTASPPTTGSTTTAEAPTTTGAPTTGDTTTTTLAGPGCVLDLRLVNAEAAGIEGLADGPLDIRWAIADKGPHPDNTVTYDQELQLGFATVEIPPDPQFGIGIPVDPDIPDGGLYYYLSLFVRDDVVTPGQRYVDQLAVADTPDADGEINFEYLESAGERLLPGDVAVTITHLDDEIVCGTLESRTETTFQSFVGVEGSFVVDRVQALEAG